MRIYPFKVRRAVVKCSLPTPQEKDGDLFAFANRNHSSNAARGLACLLPRDVAFAINKRFDPFVCVWRGFPPKLTLILRLDGNDGVMCQMWPG